MFFLIPLIFFSDFFHHSQEEHCQALSLWIMYGWEQLAAFEAALARSDTISMAMATFSSAAL